MKPRLYQHAAATKDQPCVISVLLPTFSKYTARNVGLWAFTHTPQTVLHHKSARIHTVFVLCCVADICIQSSSPCDFVQGPVDLAPYSIKLCRHAEGEELCVSVCVCLVWLNWPLSLLVKLYWDTTYMCCTFMKGLFVRIAQACIKCDTARGKSPSCWWSADDQHHQVDARTLRKLSKRTTSREVSWKLQVFSNSRVGVMNLGTGIASDGVCNSVTKPSRF